MLILTRRPGESIMIQSDEAAVQEGSNDSVNTAPLMTMHVLRVKGSQVSIGFDAPSHVKIYRKEILRKIQQQSGNVADNVSEGEYDSGYATTYHDEEEYY